MDYKLRFTVLIKNILILKLIFKKFWGGMDYGFFIQKNLIFLKNLGGTQERGGTTMGFTVYYSKSPCHPHP